LILLIAALTAMCTACKNDVSKKRQHALAKIGNAGGVTAIDQEAHRLLKTAKDSSKEVVFLNNDKRQEFPALFSLGNSVEVYPDSSDSPAHISIRYGTHNRTEFILIFSQQLPVDWAEKNNFIRITDTIFFSK
jgi:GT2 family glycosyltransferase